MVVIADSSPLIVLVNLGYVEVLPALFGQVTIPPQVAAELAQPNRPRAVRDFITRPPTWLSIRAPLRLEAIVGLHAGEIAAISLATELRADILLIDEADGRKAAKERNLPVAGTVGVLERAASQRLLNLKVVFDRLKQTDFWISPRLLDERLSLHLQRQQTRDGGGPAT